MAAVTVWPWAFLPSAAAVAAALVHVPQPEAHVAATWLTCGYVAAVVGLVLADGVNHDAVGTASETQRLQVDRVARDGRQVLRHQLVEGRGPMAGVATE